MFFINNAMATEIVETAQTTEFNSFIGSIMPLLIFVLVFYFLLIRPQQKKQKEHQLEISSLKINDKVITAGGIYGVVKKVKEETLIVEVANQVEIEILSSSVNLLKKEEKSVVKTAPENNKSAKTNTSTKTEKNISKTTTTKPKNTAKKSATSKTKTTKKKA